MHASIAEKGIVFDFAINKQWKVETQSYTNDLHDALLLKKVPLFGSVGSLNLKKNPKNTQKERASLPFGRYQIITR